MKRSVPTLVLLALLALVLGVSSLAEASATAAPAASPAPTLLSADEFLETLASPATALDKAALSASPSSCTVTGCPTAGEKCCYPCGIPGCNWVCMQVRSCPWYP